MIMMFMKGRNPTPKGIRAIRKSFSPPHNLVLASFARRTKPAISNLFPQILIVKTIMASKLFECWYFDLHRHLTPGSPSKFLMAAFVRIFAQKVTAEICLVQPLVIS
ncbi:hypothetical protein ACNPKB_16400 [Shewanella marisflavi]|uniref:hypothetical protein n=1 Tax=Shewanella marisflavi TaxID=260364 RepID=UPI003AAC08DC